MNKILPIYEVKNYKDHFTFIPLYMLDLTEDEKESLIKFMEDKESPTAEPFKENEVLIYTWDFFTWLRKYKELQIDRSINKIGLGYCSSCGKLVTFDKKCDKWLCRQCGYKNEKIFNHNWKKEEA